MRNNKELKMGVILSYLNLFIGNLIPFIYTPIMLRILGQAEYGLYSIANSVIGYLSLLSFGMGSTIVRYVTKYRVENDKEKEEGIIGLFFIIYIVLAILVFFGGYYLANYSDVIFQQGLTLQEISKIKILIYIMTFNTAISFPISVFTSITIAHEKYIFRKLIDMISTIMVPVSNIIVLYLGFGSIGMAFTGTILQFCILPINGIYCLKKIHIKPSFKHVPFNFLKEILGFSMFIFLDSMVDILFWSTDKIILGSLIGTVATAVYSVGGTFSNMMQNLSVAISSILVPRITEMVLTNNNKSLWTKMFIQIGRIQFYIIALVLSGFVVFGYYFIGFIAGSGYESSYIIALLTMVPLSVPLIQNTGYNILVAQNKHRFRAVVYFIIAILNVISTYLIVPYLGGIGAALCSSIAYFIGQVVIMNIYYYRVIGIDIPLFWKSIFNMSKIPLLMICVSVVLLKFIDMSNVINFMLGVIAFTITYLLLSYKFNMNDYEKELTNNILNKVMLKLR